jgi:hypothetical protein
MVDLIRKQFVTLQQMVIPQAGSLFIKDPIGKGQGNTKRYDEIDTQTFARRKRERENAKKASVGVGYNVTMTKKRIAMEIDISQEMRDENRNAEVGSLITSLKDFCPQRIELDMTHVLTFATSTTYVDMDGDTNTTTVGDGLALASTVHKLKFSTVTYSNRVTGDPVFSRGGLEAAETLATTNILSNFGERRVLKFTAIITGDDPNTVNTVSQYLNSSSDPDQNNSGVLNVNKGKYRHVILPYLATTATGAYDSTKAKWWFLGAIGQGATASWQAYFGIWETTHFKDLTTDERGANHDYSADTWVFGVRSGYGVRAVSGRGLIGSYPTS